MRKMRSLILVLSLEILSNTLRPSPYLRIPGTDSTTLALPASV